MQTQTPTIHKKAASPLGLTTEEALASRREHGANLLSPQKKRSFARRFLANLGDPVIKILLCALAVNLIFIFRNAVNFINNHVFRRNMKQ